MTKLDSAAKGGEARTRYEEEFRTEKSDGGPRFVAPGADQAFMATIGAKTALIEASLASQPLVPLFLPEKSSSGHTEEVKVQIGQVKFSLARGVALEVPEQIAEIVKAADVW